MSWKRCFTFWLQSGLPNQLNDCDSFRAIYLALEHVLKVVLNCGHRRGDHSTRKNLNGRTEGASWAVIEVWIERFATLRALVEIRWLSAKPTTCAARHDPKTARHHER